MPHRFMRTISLLLIISFLLLDFSVQTAKAGMITTDTAIAVATAENDRAHLIAFLDRPELQKAMMQQGISGTEAKQRVASLSDTEVTKIAHAMKQLPAGGDALGTVVGATLLVFFVLLLTDIMGLTRVFPFVKH